MAADDLEIEGARASAAAKVLSSFFHKISAI